MYSSCSWQFELGSQRNRQRPTSESLEMYTHKVIRAYMHSHTPTRTLSHTPTRTHTHAHTRMHTHMHTYTHTYIHTCTHTHTHAHTHTLMHTHRCSHTYTLCGQGCIHAPTTLLSFIVDLKKFILRLLLKLKLIECTTTNTLHTSSHNYCFARAGLIYLIDIMLTNNATWP